MFDIDSELSNDHSIVAVKIEPEMETVRSVLVVLGTSVVGQFPQS